MKTIYPFFFLILLLSISCTTNKRTESNEQTIDSLGLISDRITNMLGETLNPSAKEDLDTWQGYKDVDALMLSYYNISMSDALSNANELSGLIEIMKDSIPLETLNKPNVIARFNVLHNEALRLADMANISSITEEEVAQEVAQLLKLYSAVNSKINTVYQAIDLQNALEVDTEKPIDLDEEELAKKEMGVTVKTKNRN